jgi:uncharacterized protein YraI
MYSDFEKVKCRTTSALNFRKGPGTENEIICVIPNGTLVEINGVNEDGRWGTIEYKDQKGWICLDYVAPEDETVTEDTAVTEKTKPETTKSEETVPPVTEEQKPETTEPVVTVPPVTEEQKPETTEPVVTVPPVTEEQKPVTTESDQTAPPAADKTEPAADTMPSGQILGSAVYNLTVIKPEPDEAGILRGDVDRNGFINVLDYIMLKKHFEGRSETEMSEEADVNSDGSVTLNDLMMLRSVFRSGK